MAEPLFEQLSRRTRVKCLVSDCAGSVVPILAIMLVVLFGTVGVAIDFARMYQTNSKLQTVADAAALGATSAALSFIAENGIQGNTAIEAAKAKAVSVAESYFKGNIGSEGAYASGPSISVALNNGQLSVTVKYAGAVDSTLGRVLDINSLALSGTATAVGALPPFVEVHILVDTSGSMAIGASQSDQQVLTAQTGCAFACHDGVPVNGYPDAYAYAVGNGLTLRYTAVQNGIATLLDEIDKIDTGSQFISTAVYSFNNTLTINSSLTADTSAVRSALPQAPAISGMTEGGTHFNEIIRQVISRIGDGGDGKSAANPVKLLIIATDGVQDPGRYWTTDVPARAQVDVFDMSFCDPLKAAGVEIGIIHTPYIEIPTDWGYVATLGQPSQNGGPGARIEDITPALKNCAASRYVEASDAATIQSAFTKIFQSLGGIYLTN
jgi:Flp pilus assembly protein TadG